MGSADNPSTASTARSRAASKWTTRAGSAPPESSCTTGSSTPATTCALVTTRSSATTNPLPVWFCPHWNAVPVIFRTEAEALRSPSVSGMPAGTSTCCGAALSRMVGSPSDRVNERSCAVQRSTGSGVRRSIPASTRDEAICWETAGMPRVVRLKARMDITSAATPTFSTPPSARSRPRSGRKFSQRRSPAPRAAPAAWPPITSTTATARTTTMRQVGSGTQAETNGTAKNAATPPARKPSSPPSVTIRPLRSPATR